VYCRWVADDWGPCSVTCAGGTRFRHVHCAEESNGTRSKVSLQLVRCRSVTSVVVEMYVRERRVQWMVALLSNFGTLVSFLSFENRDKLQ